VIEHIVRRDKVWLPYKFDIYRHIESPAGGHGAGRVNTANALESGAAPAHCDGRFAMVSGVRGLGGTAGGFKTAPTRGIPVEFRYNHRFTRLAQGPCASHPRKLPRAA
jgi:hypothetical protein